MVDAGSCIALAVDTGSCTAPAVDTRSCIALAVETVNDTLPVLCSIVIKFAYKW